MGFPLQVRDLLTAGLATWRFYAQSTKVPGSLGINAGLVPGEGNLWRDPVSGRALRIRPLMGPGLGRMDGL